VSTVALAARVAPSALETLAHYTAGLRLASLPADVVAKAKLCILDAISGCLTVGTNLESDCALAIAASRGGAAGSATVIGTAVRSSAADAAFVNAVSAAGTSRSDTHPATATHPGTAIVPAVLAMAEACGRPGSAVIEAVVAGYEVMCRLGLALVTPEFATVFRPTGMVAPTGAAIAAAKVLGLDPRRMMHAASLATHTASGLNEWAAAGTSELPFHSGFAARNGVDCALLAEAGMVSARTILEGSAGLLAGHGALGRAWLLTEGLGDDHLILGVVHKPAPACIYAQTPCQLARRLVLEHGLDADAIRSVVIRVSRAAAMYPGCDDPGPIADAQAAKLSIQFAVASVLVARGVFDSNWRNFTDARANALSARCTVEADEGLSAAGPRQASRIVVTLHGGRVIEASQDDFISMSPSDLVERFRSAADPRLGVPARMRALELIDRLERLEDVGELAAALAAPG